MKKQKIKLFALRRILIIWVLMLFMVVLFAGKSMFTAMAKEERVEINPYYTSIQIQTGDSLWQIADKFCQGSHLTKGEYIEVLKKINRLSEDTIHAGQYLTVVYYE